MIGTLVPWLVSVRGTCLHSKLTCTLSNPHEIRRFNYHKTDIVNLRATWISWMRELIDKSFFKKA